MTGFSRTRHRAAHRGILAGALALAALVGCGSSEDKPKPSIPSAATQALNRELDAVESRLSVGGGACRDIQTRSRPDIERQLRNLPDSVNSEVRSALERSFEHLFDLADEECDSEPTPTQTQEAPAVPTQPQETQTQETQTQETERQEPEKPEKPQKPEKPKDGGGGNDGGGESGDEGGAGLPGGGQ